jgi:glycerol-3-phosphate dehydrogenase
MDDARVCLANILQAIQFGACCGNYVKLLALEQVKGRLCGAVVEDLRTGHQFDVHAAVLVNAAGPWGDSVRRMSDRTASPRLAPTKGIHLVVPRLTTQPIFFQHRRGRRMIFVLPWGSDYSLIGTTESSDVADLDALRATASEVEYLLEAVNRILLPAHRLQASDVVATFAGARPLLAFAGSSTRASREHRLDVDGQGLVSVLGGKYTTYRLMAQQTLDLIGRGCSERGRAGARRVARHCAGLGDGRRARHRGDRRRRRPRRLSPALRRTARVPVGVACGRDRARRRAARGAARRGG